jgi:3,4-dihydroxy-2-butanone 4-phosphate synthase
MRPTKRHPGIGADRARTIRVAIDPDSQDLVRPARIFPLRARPNGVLERRGQTEARSIPTRLAGPTPGGVLCEVMNSDRTMARGGSFRPSAAARPMVTVEIAAHLNADPHAITAARRHRRRWRSAPSAFSSSPRLTAGRARLCVGASL